MNLKLDGMFNVFSSSCDVLRTMVVAGLESELGILLCLRMRKDYIQKHGQML